MDKEFEVYVAKDMVSGEVMYVGEGKIGRHQHVNSGVSHNRDINKHFFTVGKLSVDVVGTFSTKAEAVQLEELLIWELKPKYNCVSMSMSYAERQREGIALAKKRGVYKGRKRALSPEQASDIKQRIANGERVTAIAREVGLSRETIYRYIKDAH